MMVAASCYEAKRREIKFPSAWNAWTIGEEQLLLLSLDQEANDLLNR